MAKSDEVKIIKLKRNKESGYGFSIIGGAGSEFPPLIYDIIQGSPAANSKLSPGDIICEINGLEVLSLTTKEVLNCLKLASTEVTLALKEDTVIQAKVHHLLDGSSPDALRSAITHDDLHGINQIHAKKNSETDRSHHKVSFKNIPQKGCPQSNFDSLSEGGSSNYVIAENDAQIQNQKDSKESKQIKMAKKRSEGDSVSSNCKPDFGQKNTSPPFSEDDSEDIESLHSFHYSPKAVDLPSAVRLANRLYTLDGFKKSDISRHLSKNNEFSKAVAEEYLNHFEFTRDTLDVALRKFLDKFCLSGETQERERVLVHFSKKFLDCNPGTFNSQDAVHTLTCALMLLNTDLHGQNIGRKMTSSEFIDNLAELNDGENFPKDTLKALYQAIRIEPLKWATDEDEEENVAGRCNKGQSISQNDNPIAAGSNQFLTPPSGGGILYKKGYIMRKCCVDPNGKRTAFGKRSWKMWFCIIQDLSLYFHKDEQGARKGPQPQLGQNVVRLHHSIAIKAHDYSKKAHVCRLHTADQAQYLLQTSDSKELDAWIDAINFVAASLSAAPLPGAVGSQQKFQRPLLPCSITKLHLFNQFEDHNNRLNQLEEDLNDHKAHPIEKTSKSSAISNYKEKEAYLTSEVKRYQVYVSLLRTKMMASLGSSLSGVPAHGAIEMTELPVFEAPTHGNSTEGTSEAASAAARVIPPPIPERARPTDSADEITDTESQTSLCKKSKEELQFDRELSRFLKERAKARKPAFRIGPTDVDEEPIILPYRETKSKDKNDAKPVNMKEDDNNEASVEEDPRMGTFNRLSAIFKFSKLNREQRVTDDDKGEQNNGNKRDKKNKKSRKKDKNVKIPEMEKETETAEGKPPPLPPKPDPNSPVRRMAGTRINI